MVDPMKPEASELAFLNPRIASKGVAEINRLISTIDECGWEWDPTEKGYYNKELNRNIRVDGLDLFSAEKFQEYHDHWAGKLRRNPTGYAREMRGMYLWQRFGTLSVGIVFLVGLFGWTVLSVSRWLLATAVAIAVVIGLYKYARTGLRRRT